MSTRTIVGGTLAAFLIAYFASMALFHWKLHDWSSRHQTDPAAILFLPESLTATALQGAWGEKQLCCDYSLVLDPHGETMTFAVATDQPKVEGKRRAEVRHLSHEIGQRYRYRLDVRADEGWEFTEHPTVATQWHGTKDIWFLEQGRKPPLVLHAIGEEWVVAIASDRQFINPMTTEAKEERIASFPIVPGKWVSLEFDVLWSAGDEGRIVITRDGEEIARHEGPNCFNDIIGPYWKYGNYQPKQEAAATVGQRTVSLRNVSWEKMTP